MNLAYNRSAHCTQVAISAPWGSSFCNSSLPNWIWIIFHTIVVHLPRVCPRSRSQCTFTENLCPDHNSSLSSWIWIIFHTLIVHDLIVCYDLDPRSNVHVSPRSRSQCIHTPKPFHGHNFSLPSWIWIIFHTIIIQLLSMTQGHIFKVKVTVNIILKICVRAITPHCKLGSVLYLTHLLSMTQWCVMTLTQDHIVKVTVHTYPKFVPGP